MLVEVVAGLAAGALHVWSGPDHLAAVAPLAVRGRRRSWAVGMRWGIGHSAGVAAVALFLVWAHNRQNSTSVGRFAPGESFDELPQIPADNILMAKVTWWLNP